jgi:putative flippase GtrA
MSNIPVIIPSYEPDYRLLELLEGMSKSKIGPVIVINDGSGALYDEIFDKARQIITPLKGNVLTHKSNQGKGKALKTAFQYVLENIPDAVGVVTADSDGQHTITCIISIVEALEYNQDKLILGVRQFDGEGIPWKSRFGNDLTEKVFSYVSGVHISDTQTGLRGIPRKFMSELLSVDGERFEFEMRMLLKAADEYEILEIPIETIYDSKKNHQTHFNPIKDSIKIYRILGGRFLRFIIASFSSSLLDLILFKIFCDIFKNRKIAVYIACATIIARVLSAFYNYLINYKIVFKSQESISKSSIKYIVLAILQMGFSAIFVSLLVSIFSIVPEVIFKIIVDTILFFVSYHIQRRYIFGK